MKLEIDGRTCLVLLFAVFWIGIALMVKYMN